MTVRTALVVQPAPIVTGLFDFVFPGFGETVVGYRMFGCKAHTFASLQTDQQFSVGFSDLTDSLAIGQSAQHNAMNGAVRRGGFTKPWVLFDSAGTIIWSCDNVGAIANGIRVNFTVVQVTNPPQLGVFLYGGADFQCKAHALNIIATTTVVTAPGFEPDDVDTISNRSTTIQFAGITTTGAASYGVVKNDGGPTFPQKSINTKQPNAPATTDNALIFRTDRVLDNPFNIDRPGHTINNFGAVGFDIVRSHPTDSPIGMFSKEYNGAARVEVGQFNMPASPDSAFDILLPWRAQAVIFLMSSTTLENLVDSSDTMFGLAFGIVCKRGGSVCFAHNSEDNVMTSNTGNYVDRKAMAMPDEAGLIANGIEASLVALMSDRVRLDITKTISGAKVAYWALEDIDPVIPPSDPVGPTTGVSALKHVASGPTIAPFPLTLSTSTAFTTGQITATAVIITNDAPIHIRFSAPAMSATTFDLLLPAGAKVFPIFDQDRLSIIESVMGPANVSVHTVVAIEDR